MSNVDVLFGSYRLNALNLPNRVVMAPMTRSMSPGGVPTAEVASYYRRRAENGVGLIITEAAGIGRPAALNEPDMPRFHGEAALAGWKKVVDEVHAAGGRIAPQLVHVGHKLSNLTPDWAPSAPYESPSGFSVTGERISQPMSESDVANAIDAFARAASDAERLGFDAIGRRRWNSGLPCSSKRVRTPSISPSQNSGRPPSLRSMGSWWTNAARFVLSCSAHSRTKALPGAPCSPFAICLRLPATVQPAALEFARCVRESMFNDPVPLGSSRKSPMYGENQF